MVFLLPLPDYSDEMNEDIKQQRGKRIRRFKESVHEYFPKNVPKFLDQETFPSRTSFIIN